MARATAEVDLLQEFRTRLVADVVTGQLDVRDIATSLGEIDVNLPVSDQFSTPEDSALDDVMEMSEV
jgi:type I restriction enzyme S subunit